MDRSVHRLQLHSSVNNDTWRTSVSRRAFARSLAGLTAGLAGFPSLLGAIEHDSDDTLLIAITHRSGDIPFVKGADMGIAEAERTATLFGKTIRSRHVMLDDQTNTAELADSLARGGAQLVVTCAGDSQLAALAKECTRHGIAVFNCCARSDSLRQDLCRTGTFHIEASDAMYRDAERQSANAKSIVLWDASLEKYGAAQLNDRFRSFAHAPMDAAAWAGWVAVKIGWESFLRAPSSWRANLLSEKAQFDGHKGAPLSFRSWDHQLRQPLYAMMTGHAIDVPDIGRSQQPIRDLLDTLGDGPSAQSCPGTVTP